MVFQIFLALFYTPTGIILSDQYGIKHRVSHKVELLLNSGLKDVITRMATLGIIFLNSCYHANL